MHSRYCSAALLVVMVVVTAAWATAQSVAIQPVTPTVLSAGDLGFRVEGHRGGKPVGTLVVKINGQWVEAELASPGPKAISAK